MPSVALVWALACSSSSGSPPITAVGDTSGNGPAGANAAAGASGMMNVAGAVASTAGSANDAGSGGTQGSAGAAGSSGASGSAGSSNAPHGPSMGCGQDAASVSSGSFTNFKITIPTCGNGVTYPDCIDPHFAPGFMPDSESSYAMSSDEDYNHRDYELELPSDYDPSTPYPIFLGGSGCGAGRNGFDPGTSAAIRVHLSIMNGCFADGGGSCAGNLANLPNCKLNPELPYFRAVLADVESKLCVDTARVFVGGNSSGAWETQTLGCGAANLVRGIVTLEGGLRNTQPACTGPVAALMVVGGVDGTNPIGPLVKDTPYTAGGLSADQVNSTITDEDSNGSAPARDAILTRNHCTGSATAPYDPSYPDCVQYTGCPPEYPVVWCVIPTCAHICSNDGDVNYSPGSVQGDPLMWSFLSKLPPVN